MRKNGTLVFLINLIALSVAPACAAPVKKDGSAKPDRQAPLSKHSVSVWKCRQKIPFGVITGYISKDAIRLDGNKGGRLIARAPEWKVNLFNTADKTELSLPYSKWLTISEHKQVYLERAGVKPKKTKICGLPALYYDFAVNTMGDSEAGFGSLFRARQIHKMFKYRRLSVAENTMQLPPQATEIWRIHAEVPFIGSLPLELFDAPETGQPVYAIQTFSQEYATVPSDFFEYKPKGFKKGGTATVVFYGNEFEDAVQMMLGDP